MGMRNLLLFIIFIFICLISSGQSESSKVEFDSLINYEVKKKETLYSISNKFNLQIDDIIKYNFYSSLFCCSFFLNKLNTAFFKDCVITTHMYLGKQK